MPTNLRKIAKFGIKFYKTLCRRFRVDTCGQTSDGRGKANRRCFYNSSANATKYVKFYLVHFCTLITVFYVKTRLMHYKCQYHFVHTFTHLHVSAFKWPPSGSTDTFREKGQQITYPDINITLLFNGS